MRRRIHVIYEEEDTCHIHIGAHGRVRAGRHVPVEVVEEPILVREHILAREHALL
jgi:hypothetical protein